MGMLTAVPMITPKRLINNVSTFHHSKVNDINKLGKLLYQSHEGLSAQYKVSCTELDFLVNRAKENPNVLGARMMGGGFGGCTINLVLKNVADDFAKEVYHIIENKNPKLHYKIGAFMQKFSIVLKRILPDRIYESMLMNHYKLKG